MSPKHIFQVLFCVAFFAMTSTTALAGFSITDCVGTWYAHQIVSGDATDDDPRCGYGTMQVDNLGNASYRFTSPPDASETGQATMQITGNGIVTIDNSTLTHGSMNDMKDQIVLVDNTSGNGGTG